MTAIDTLRWGDSQQLAFVVQSAGTRPQPVAAPTKQLVQARWRWPLAWNVLLVMVPAFASSETATFTVTFNVTTGVGQGTLSYPYAYTLAPTAGVYAPIVDQKIIPAENLQITATLTGTPGAPVGTAESVQVGAFAAPTTEPHAMTEILGRLAGAPEDAVRWMGPGFREEPLRYGR